MGQLTKGQKEYTLESLTTVHREPDGDADETEDSTHSRKPKNL